MLCAKNPFFAVREQNKQTQRLAWVSTPHRGKCFLLSDPIVVGLMLDYCNGEKHDEAEITQAPTEDTA